MRSVGSEVLSVAMVLAIPLGLAAVFPRAALSPLASPAEERKPSAAILFLSDAEVSRALRAAKDVTRHDGVGRANIELLPEELPGGEGEVMMTSAVRCPAAALPLVETGRTPFLPSRRADAPIRISSEAEKPDPVFSRQELLKLN